MGKTTVAAGLARLAAGRGLRVLAVDAVASGHLEAALADSRSDDREVLDAQPGFGSITVLALETQQALDEYVKIYLKIPIAPSSLGPLARIFDFVSAAAPGVREILTVGKIGYEAMNGGWDEIVVDAPATGHVVELLTAPESLAAIAATGPLAGQTGWLREVLAAPTTGAVVVSLPEELPIAESGELIGRLRNETEVDLHALVANRVPADVGDEGRKETRRLIDGDHPLAALAVVAGERPDQARPFVDQLASLAEREQLTLIVVQDQPRDPVGAVIDACREVDL